MTDSMPILSNEAAALFAEQALFQVKPENKHASCVDGRYEIGTAGAIAIAGADTGFLEAALAAGNQLRERGHTIPDDQTMLDLVFSACGGKQKFQYHTDDHAGLNGCGHNLRAVTRASEYGLTSEQATLITETLTQLQAEGITPTELHGGHAEAGVLVVNLPEYQPDNPEAPAYSLHHQAMVNSILTQAFVYNQTLVQERFHLLAKLIITTTPATDLTEEMVFAALTHAEESQRTLTVKDLALSKGLRAYSLDINSSGAITQITQIA